MPLSLRQRRDDVSERTERTINILCLSASDEHGTAADTVAQGEILVSVHAKTVMTNNLGKAYSSREKSWKGEHRTTVWDLEA